MPTDNKSSHSSGSGGASQGDAKRTWDKDDVKAAAADDQSKAADEHKAAEQADPAAETKKAEAKAERAAQKAAEEAAAEQARIAEGLAAQQVPVTPATYPINDPRHPDNQPKPGSAELDEKGEARSE